MEKILIVDNHSEDIKLLVKLLNEHYTAFVKKYNTIPSITKLCSKIPPPIEGYYYGENTYEEENSIQGGYIYIPEKKEVVCQSPEVCQYSGAGFVSMLSDGNYCLIDVCLNNIEEVEHILDGKVKHDIEKTSGYEFAQKIKNSGKKIAVSMISRIIPPSESANQEITIITKPFRKNTRKMDETSEIDSSVKAGNFYIADLPRSLWTNKPDEAFSNMVYYKFFNKCGTAT